MGRKLKIAINYTGLINSDIECVQQTKQLTDKITYESNGLIEFDYFCCFWSTENKYPYDIEEEKLVTHIPNFARLPTENTDDIQQVLSILTPKKHITATYTDVYHNIKNYIDSNTKNLNWFEKHCYYCQNISYACQLYTFAKTTQMIPSDYDVVVRLRYDTPLRISYENLQDLYNKILSEIVNDNVFKIFSSAFINNDDGQIIEPARISFFSAHNPKLPDLYNFKQNSFFISDICFYGNYSSMSYYSKKILNNQDYFYSTDLINCGKIVESHWEGFCLKDENHSHKIYITSPDNMIFNHYGWSERSVKVRSNTRDRSENRRSLFAPLEYLTKQELDEMKQQAELLINKSKINTGHTSMFNLATFTSGEQEVLSLSLFNNDEPKWREKHKSFLINDLDALNLFNRKNINDIPLGSKYVVYLHAYIDLIQVEPKYDWMVNHHKFATGNETFITEFPMLPRVWDDSANGLVHWVIDFGTESNITDTLIFDKLLKGLNCSRHPKNVTFMTAGETDIMYSNRNLIDDIEDKYKINVVLHNVLHTFIDHIHLDQELIRKKIHNIMTCQIHNYKSVCYNRRPRAHRAILIAHMMYKNYTSDSIYSFGDGSYRVHSEHIRRFPHLEEHLNYLSSVPFINAVLEEGLDLKENQAQTINLNHSLNSAFHIVSETISSPFTFITEKSYKPFFMMQPFIALGNQYNVRKLRNMGFRVYDQWINHSYDEIHDPMDRLDAFLLELDRLHTISHEEWSNILFDMRGDLLYNYYKVCNLKMAFPSDLFKILMEFMK